jgi:hypothetical protein
MLLVDARHLRDVLRGVSAIALAAPDTNGGGSIGWAQNVLVQGFVTAL